MFLFHLFFILMIICCYQLHVAGPCLRDNGVVIYSYLVSLFFRFKEGMSIVIENLSDLG